MKPADNPRRRPGYEAALGRALKVLRTEQGLERRELAERAGISYSYLAEIENGNKPPSSKVLMALADVLEVRPAQLHAAADSLREGMGAGPSARSRLTDIAASAQRAWSPGVPHRLAAEHRMQPSPAPPVPADRQRMLDQLHQHMEHMSDDDLAMMLAIVERLGETSGP